MDVRKPIPGEACSVAGISVIFNLAGHFIKSLGIGLMILRDESIWSRKMSAHMHPPCNARGSYLTSSISPMVVRGGAKRRNSFRAPETSLRGSSKLTHGDDSQDLAGAQCREEAIDSSSGVVLPREDGN